MSVLDNFETLSIMFAYFAQIDFDGCSAKCILTFSVSGTGRREQIYLALKMLDH